LKYRRLGKTELKVSVVSCGTTPLGNEYRQIDISAGIRALHLALDLGVNFIDTSPYYDRTKSELVLGQGLAQIDRHRYYLATKVGRYDLDEFDFSADRVTRSIDKSLQRLKVGYLNLIQCHDNEFGNLDQVVNETIPALQKAKQVCAQVSTHCRRQGGDLAELGMQFSLANPNIHSTLMGTANPDNVRKNIDCLTSTYDVDLLAEVQEMLKPIHNRTWISGRPENT
jgi:aryl-alcohol dehydrogenase-like predicted oxidoreductase